MTTKGRRMNLQSLSEQQLTELTTNLTQTVALPANGSVIVVESGTREMLRRIHRERYVRRLYRRNERPDELVDRLGSLGVRSVLSLTLLAVLTLVLWAVGPDLCLLLDEVLRLPVEEGIVRDKAIALFRWIRLPQ